MTEIKENQIVTCEGNDAKSMQIRVNITFSKSHNGRKVFYRKLGSQKAQEPFPGHSTIFHGGGHGGGHSNAIVILLQVIKLCITLPWIVTIV